MQYLLQELLLAWKKSLQAWAAEASINCPARDALALQAIKTLLNQLISE